MKKLIYISSLVILLLGFFLFYRNIDFSKKDKWEIKNQPFDNFSLQRSYPDFKMDYFAFNEELKKVKLNASINKLTVSGNWTLEGPTNLGGRINTIELHPTNSNIIFVGTSAGGVFRTLNGGLTWEPVSDDFAYLAISDITIDPNIPSTVYVGTGDLNIGGNVHIGNGIYKSTDGGTTWNHMGLSDESIISKIIVDPSNSNTIYASAMGKPMERNNFRGVYKSTDGGNSWAQVLFLSNQTGVIDMVMDPFNSNVIYCSGWDRIRTNQESLIKGNGARIWKTLNGGLNWIQLTGGLPQIPLSRIGLAVSQQTPNLVFASIVDTMQQLSSIYKSLNGGSSWSLVGQNGLDPNAMGGFGWYFGQIRVSPYDDNELSVLGIELHSTLDGGNNWSKTTPDWELYEVHADCHDLVYSMSNPNTIFLATDGGLYKTTNNMTTWTDIDEIPNTQFYKIAINPHKSGVYAGGAQDNGTTSGNSSMINSWPREFGGDGFQTIYHPTDTMIRYFETQNAGLYVYYGFMDYFDNGIDASDRTNWNTPFIMSKFNYSTMYTGTYRVYRQTGAPYGTWVPISNDLTDGVIFGNSYHTISTIAESPKNASYLYAGTSDGNVWWLNNSTWIDVTSGLPDRYVTSIQGSPDIANSVFVTHSGYKYNEYIPHIHKSINNGLSWIDISGNLPQFAINDVCIYPNSMDSVIFVATDIGVYSTINGGINWERIGDNMPFIPVFDIEIDSVNNKLVAGTFSRSIQSFPIDSIVPKLITSSQEITRLSKVNIYPIPTKNIVYIDNLSNQETVVLYDINGKKLKMMKDLENKLKIDMSQFTTGIYFVKVENGDETKMFKIVKQ
jgi:photosystem II stability/assembly factor-like uncharacterized protein